jgi:hypothetical protein
MKPTKIMLVNSILWAAAMLASAILLRGTGYYENIFMLLFTLWLASFLTYEGGRDAMECEWRMIRKFFNSLRKN